MLCYLSFIFKCVLLHTHKVFYIFFLFKSVCTWWTQKVRTTCGIYFCISQTKKNNSYFFLVFPEMCALFSHGCFVSLDVAPAYHCLDSLRPPREGKVGIYFETFGLSITEASAAVRQQSTDTNFDSWLYKKTDLDSGLHTRQVKFLLYLLYYTTPSWLCDKMLRRHSFSRSPSWSCLFLTDPEKVFHLHVGGVCCAIQW